MAVVCVFAVVARGARGGFAIALGAAAAISAVCLPFFVAAPAQMWRMVVLDQVGRDQGASLLLRAAQIVTMGRVPSGIAAHVVVVLAVVAFVACSVIAWRAKPFRVVVPLLASMVALLLVSPIFFPHYLGTLAVPTALLAGVVTGVLDARPQPVAWRLAIAVAGCLALAVDAVALSRIRSGDPIPAPLRAAVRPLPGCVTSDDPNNLLGLGLVGRNVERGCALVVDLGGYSHDLSQGSTVSRRRNLPWQRFVLQYLGSGQHALVTRFGRGEGLAPATAAEIESWPVRLRVEDLELRQPPG